jgi:hypothetical protein
VRSRDFAPPVPGTPEGTHARDRGRPGAGIAVVTLLRVPAGTGRADLPGWARHGATWTSLGTMLPDASSARLIAESSVLAAPPDALEVTLEPRMGSAAPSGPVVVAGSHNRRLQIAKRRAKNAPLSGPRICASTRAWSCASTMTPSINRNPARRLRGGFGIIAADYHYHRDIVLDRSAAAA